MEDVVGLGIAEWNRQRGPVEARVTKQAVVPGSKLAPLLIPLFDVSKFHSKDGALNGIHARVPAQFFVNIAAGTSMAAKPAHVVGSSGIQGCNQSRFAVGAQILGGIKTERCCQAQSACLASSPSGADGLSRILNQHCVEFIRHGL